MKGHLMPSSTPQERLEAALAHVEAGFAAFSVWSTLDDGTCRCPKTADCVSPGKHPLPTNGFKAATTDPERLRAMMSVPSEPNYGLVWPADSPLGVVFSWDIDGEGWQDRLNDLKATYGALPPTKTTRTPHGGLHLYYRWPAGVPLPEGNMLHGFLVRWPEKGYVVGPKSRINGRLYESVAGEEIATLPPVWATGGGNPVTTSPLIRVTGDTQGYEMPTSVGTGDRHNQIAAFVAHLWNRHNTRAETDALVRAMLVPLFAEPMDETRLREEIDHAWDTAERKWVEPAGALRDEPVVVRVEATPAAEGLHQSEAAEEIVIDPLAVEMRTERPAQPDLQPFMPVALDMLISHLMTVTDAPVTSLALTSVVGLSALMGPKPTLRWRGTQRCSIFGALIGDTGYGRKGQSINEVMTALSQVDPLLPSIRESGVASGESFIDMLSGAKGEPILLVEQEMSKMLTVAAREGNTTSYVLREAWDGGPIATRSRKDGRVKASGYHLSIIGGTTPSELELRLAANDVTNGWANRWLWYWTEKRPGGYDETLTNDVPQPIIDALRDGIEFARNIAGAHLISPTFTMSLAPESTAHLRTITSALDVPAVGVIGALRQRMPPIAVRIAMVAALLDQSSVVEPEHLRFGFAMTDYAVESMRSVFGLRVDDPVAMHILDGLTKMPDGWMNTTDLKRWTGKDYPRVKTALRALMATGIVVCEPRPAGPRGGKPPVGYRFIGGLGR
jgi:hypothetical protein